jgi:hypothetical protein
MLYNNPLPGLSKNLKTRAKIEFNGPINDIIVFVTIEDHYLIKSHG